MNGEWLKVASKNKLADGIPASVEVGPRRICLVRRGDEVFAINDRCSHAESLLSPGEVEDMEIMCPLHGARFDLRTGEALTPPATLPVETYGVRIDGDDVFVQLP